MDIKKLNDVARSSVSLQEALKQFEDRSAVARIKAFIEQSAAVRCQRTLEDAAIARFQASVDNATVQAFQSQAAEAAERAWAFTSATTHAADMILTSDASFAAQALASRVWTSAMERYLQEHSLHSAWARAGSIIILDEAHVVSAQPANPPIKASIPKIRLIAQAKLTYARAAEPEIELPPAHHLARAFRYVLTKGAYKRTVEPHLIDLYDEYSEAIQQGEEARAQWIIVRGHFLIVWSQLKRPLIAVLGWLTTLKN
jgi:hypothetical protein